MPGKWRQCCAAASNHSGWRGTTRRGTPGSLVKLRNTIIAHPSLISHPSSPSPLAERYSPCNYYHSWRPKGLDWIFSAVQKMTDADQKKTMKTSFDHWLHSIGSLEAEMRRASVVDMNTSSTAGFTEYFRRSLSLIFKITLNATPRYCLWTFLFTCYATFHRDECFCIRLSRVQPLYKR